MCRVSLYLSARTTVLLVLLSILLPPSVMLSRFRPRENLRLCLFIISNIIRILFVYPPFPSSHSGTSGIAVPASVLFCRGPDNARGVMGCTSRFRSRASPRLYTLHLTPYTKHKNRTILTISAFLFAQFKKMLYICGRNYI